MRSRLTDIRDTVLVVLACVFAGVIVLGMPAIGLPLCALALGWLAFRRGTLFAVWVAAGSALLLSLADPWSGALLLPVLLAVALAPAAMKKRSPWFVMAALTAVALAAGGASMWIEAIGRNTDMVGLMRQLLAVWVDGLQMKPTAQQLADAARQLAEQWPGWLALNAGLGALLSVYALGKQATVAGVEVRALPPLYELDVSWHVTWGAIAGFALLALGRFTGQVEGLIGVAGINVMRVTGGLLALQGFAVFAGLYRKAGMGPFARWIGYGLLAITEPLTAVVVPVGLVGLTGLIDLWANLRKLPRNGQPVPSEGTEEPIGKA
jgi:hypothetical protein